ncbi:hypothetical protein EKK58_05290 [Candidatus Dependentiae bacterium]|nr:MAG: hypothetical protein EKK58_05290 [Candidatus Dependentiae bacterium]
MNAIKNRFGNARVLLPVVHCIHYAQAAAAIYCAIRNGADGVFLINQGGMRHQEVAMMAADFIGETFVGVNLLEFGRAAVYQLPKQSRVSVWSDNAGFEPNADPKQLDAFHDRLKLDRSPRDMGWQGLYFGGVAFKYQREVPLGQCGGEAILAAQLGVDVVTTSGPATGHPPSPEKVQAMHTALVAARGDHALAIASGITPENVEPFLPYVNAFLVATGIESSFGVFDPGRVQALADAIHGFDNAAE